ncbi:MAG: endo alpha-1,4 polygalactosaminidase [Aeromicrobium erythreum]
MKHLVLVVALLLCCSCGASAEPTPAPAVTPLPLGAVVDYQLGGAYAPADDVTVVVRDRTAAADPDRYSVCYVNTFQTQPGSLGWWKKHHPRLLLRDRKGRAVRDPGWPDEVLLDLRGDARRTELAGVLSSWFARCAKDGYRAIEADNLDSFTRSRKLLTKAQATSMARLMVQAAHRHGLAIAQKNTPEIDGRRVGFDFAVAEECQVYAECGRYLKSYPGRVVEIEYTDNGRKAYATACAQRAGQHPILLRDRDVVPRGAKGYLYRHC